MFETKLKEMVVVLKEDFDAVGRDDLKGTDGPKKGDSPKMCRPAELPKLIEVCCGQERSMKIHFRFELCNSLNH